MGKLLGTRTARRKVVRNTLIAIPVVITIYAFAVWLQVPDMWNIEQSKAPVYVLAAKALLTGESVILVLILAVLLVCAANVIGEKVSAWVRSGA